MARRATSTYGFKRTYGLLESRIRKAGEARGFAVSRLLTHWDEVAGADIAAMARPVLVHRMALNFAARARGESLAQLIDSTTETVLRHEAAA